MRREKQLISQFIGGRNGEIVFYEQRRPQMMLSYQRDQVGLELAIGNNPPLRRAYQQISVLAVT
ncbi:hypothetical protein SAMN05445060_1859 [Williamsia sterculiae]|uniref:Uncharacterized protein n=1 Tax=Williamsia sterculiae TaxID=1344003 RepID=A0A1N7F6F1_9NOCA|nr:hypothetical protein SAMN05445060_1859 [Williamsia sterculiae]